MTPDKVIAAARGLLGTPYAHQGRTPGQRIDCVGVLACVARKLGIPFQDFLTYGRTPHHGTLMRELDKRMPRAADYAPGCVAVMRWDKTSEPQHCAILTDGGTMIHAYGGGPEKVAEHRIDSQWRSRFVAAYAFPGVTYPPAIVPPTGKPA